jgi:hypothetical protein
VVPPVLILLGTRDGAAHLPAQLASFEAQEGAEWTLWASDDGSTDATRAILEDFRARHPDRVRLLDGPRLGSAANYLGLLARGDLPEGPVALADQDDVWLPHRLARGLSHLGGGEATVVAGATIRVDEDLRPLDPSPLPPRPPGFANALVQNVLAGNTMLLDPGAVALVRRTAQAALAHGVRHHDWWVYLVASGAGARIVIDPVPGVLYRQHGANHMGAHRGLAAFRTRVGNVRRGDWRDWVGRNLAALDAARGVLTPEARSLRDEFARVRALPSGIARMRALRAAGIRRQTPAQDAAMGMLALLGWL